jgi:hypothetical protein
LAVALIFEDPRNGNGIKDSDHFGTRNQQPATNIYILFIHSLDFLLKNVDIYKTNQQNIVNLMIKKFIAILGLSFVLTGLIYPQTSVSVDMDIPEEVKAGEDFDVNIIISKGDLEEFSRFQQELPFGLTAAPVNSGTADFSFDNQRIRFIWLKLPAEEKINISYRVSVHERLKGQFTITGEFSYIENNERNAVNVDSDPVRILPSSSVAENMQVDVSEFEEVLTAEKTARESRHDISCYRQTPFRTTTGNDIIVRLLVYKKGMDKFAKIEEHIPGGFDAKVMDSKDGIFTYKDGLAKFVWMNLPPESGFVISYSLIPSSGKSINDLSISGQLSYIYEGRNIVIDVVQKDIDLSNLDPGNIEQLLTSVQSGEPPPPPPQPKETSEKVEMETTRVTPTEQVVDVTESKPLTHEPEKRYSDIPPTLLLPVEAGIYYRVQLAAAHRLVDPVSIYKKYNFERPVKIEYHDGWYKFTIGSFSTYSSANNFREMVVNRKKISGAFIVAYQNGKRIEVAEAWRLIGRN